MMVHLYGIICLASEAPLVNSQALGPNQMLLLEKWSLLVSSKAVVVPENINSYNNNIIIIIIIIYYNNIII